MRWQQFPEWTPTEDRRIYQTDWAQSCNSLSRTKRFFAVYEEQGKMKVISLGVVQAVSFVVLPTTPRQMISETDSYTPIFEREDKAFSRLVEMCNFLEKGAL